MPKEKGLPDARAFVTPSDAWRNVKPVSAGSETRQPLPTSKPVSTEDFDVKGIKPKSKKDSDIDLYVKPWWEMPPYDPAYPVDERLFSVAKGDEDFDPFQVSHVARFFGNIPKSMAHVAGGLAQAVTNPTSASEGILRVVAGSGAEVGRHVLGMKDTPNARLFRGVAGHWLQRMKEFDKTLIEDPVGALLDVTAIGGILGRAMGLQQVSKALKTVNPASVAPRAVKTTGEFLTSEFPEVLGFSTGHPPGSFRKAAEIGRRGTPEENLLYQSARSPRQAAKQGKRQPRDIEIVKSSQEAGVLVQQYRSKEYQANLLKVEQEAPVDLLRIKRDVLEDMKKRGIYIKIDPESGKFARRGDGKIDLRFNMVEDEGRFISGEAIVGGTRYGREAEQGLIRRYLTTILDWEDDTLQGLDTLKNRLYNQRPPPTSGSRLAGADYMIKEGWAAVRQELLDKFIGYKQLNEAYELKSGVIDDFVSVLSGKSPNPEAIMAKLGKYSDENYQIRNDVINTMEHVSGIQLGALLAGKSVTAKMPKGLIGRSALMGAVGIPFLAKEMLVSIMRLTVMFPLSSPRVMGKFWRGLGVTQKIVDDYEKWVAAIHRKIPEGMVVEGVSFGTVIARLAALESEAEEIDPASRIWYMDEKPTGYQGSERGFGFPMDQDPQERRKESFGFPDLIQGARSKQHRR